MESSKSHKETRTRKFYVCPAHSISLADKINNGTAEGKPTPSNSFVYEEHRREDTETSGANLKKEVNKKHLAFSKHVEIFAEGNSNYEVTVVRHISGLLLHSAKMFLSQIHAETFDKNGEKKVITTVR